MRSMTGERSNAARNGHHGARLQTAGPRINTTPGPLNAGRRFASSAATMAPSTSWTSHSSLRRSRYRCRSARREHPSRAGPTPGNRRTFALRLRRMARGQGWAMRRSRVAARPARPRSGHGRSERAHQSHPQRDRPGANDIPLDERRWCVAGVFIDERAVLAPPDPRSWPPCPRSSRSRDAGRRWGSRGRARDRDRGPERAPRRRAQRVRRSRPDGSVRPDSCPARPGLNPTASPDRGDAFPLAGGRQCHRPRNDSRGGRGHPGAHQQDPTCPEASGGARGQRLTSTRP